MAQPIAIRRSSICRQHARQLAEAATREPREIERRHLLGLAAMYQRIADNLASEKPDEIQSAEAVRLKA
ncbi:MAG: hypothetical protein WCD25_11960 [Pseudolabrys sp.]|jgi:hypothetical protein